MSDTATLIAICKQCKGEFVVENDEQADLIESYDDIECLRAHGPQRRTTTGFDHLIGVSHKVRSEFKANGQVTMSSFTSHEPTDLEKVTKGEIKTLLGGFDPDNVCPDCNMAKSKSGACTGWC